MWHIIISLAEYNNCKRREMPFIRGDIHFRSLFLISRPGLGVKRCRPKLQAPPTLQWLF